MNFIPIRWATTQLCTSKQSATSTNWLQVNQLLRLLVVGKRENPLRILPLVVRRETRKLGTAQVLTYPLNDLCPYYGPNNDRPQKTLQARLVYLLDGPCDSDFFDLRWTSPEATDAPQTLDTFRQPGFAYHATERRRKKRFDEAAELRYLPQCEKHDDADPRWNLYGTCVELAEISGHGSSEIGNTH